MDLKFSSVLRRYKISPRFEFGYKSYDSFKKTAQIRVLVETRCKQMVIRDDGENNPN